MITPFMTIDEAIAALEEMQTWPELDLCEEDMEHPLAKVLTKMMRKETLNLAYFFKNHGIDSASGLYAEVVCGATPSKGCNACGFVYSVHGGKPKCQFCGECTPINENNDGA